MMTNPSFWPIRIVPSAVECASCFLLLVAASALGTSSAVLAQSPVSPTGRLLASNCAQCHGTTRGSPGFDKLTGKSAAKIYSELKKFQSGRKPGNIMTRHAMGFTDPQLREIAQYLSTQK